MPPIVPRALVATVALIVLLVSAPAPGRAAPRGDWLPDQTISAPPEGAAERIGPFPICVGVARGYRERLRDGLALMQTTAEGERLFQLLLRSGVCVEAASLHPAVLAQAVTRDSPVGDWTESVVQVDAANVRALPADLLAPTLVHEAAHIERHVTGTHCHATETCTFLESGDLLEEEVAAHAAEARWWIEVYGRDGKGGGGNHVAFLDQLSRAYLAGEDAFQSYVFRYRNDWR